MKFRLVEVLDGRASDLPVSTIDAPNPGDAFLFFLSYLIYGFCDGVTVSPNESVLSTPKDKGINWTQLQIKVPRVGTFVMERVT